jgi:hypothetical protein
MNEENALIEACINRLAKEAVGVITPEAVVHEAMKPDSPLHGRFEWDKDKAAWSAWIDTARSLIRSVRIEVTTTQVTVSAVAYVRDPRCEAEQQGYISVVTLRTDADLAREALVQEFGRAAAYLKRARDLAVVLSLEAEVEGLQKQLSLLVDRVKDEARPN